MRLKLRAILYKVSSTLVSAIYLAASAQCAAGYAFNQIVPDVRQGVAMSGGSACPVRAHQRSGASNISVRWSTTLGTNPVSILTQNQTAAARLTEIEQVISQSLAAWTGVIGTTLLPASVAPLARIATQNACGSDGLNSICFDQADMAFTPGVLAFTRIITSDARPTNRRQPGCYAARPDSRCRHLFRSERFAGHLCNTRRAICFAEILRP